MTTSTSDEPGVYRSRAYRDTRSRAVTVAAAVASLLAAVGAVAMIVGIGAALGWFAMEGVRTAVLIGLGLFAMGSGALLLVVLQAWRIVTDR